MTCFCKQISLKSRFCLVSIQGPFTYEANRIIATLECRNSIMLHFISITAIKTIKFLPDGEMFKDTGAVYNVPLRKILGGQDKGDKYV